MERAPFQGSLDFQVSQMVKNLPAMRETQVQCLGRKEPWGREWLPIPVFLPGGSYGQRSLAGYSPWGHKELDTTEVKLIHTNTGVLLEWLTAAVEASTRS